MQLRQKTPYGRPLVLQETAIQLERDLLAGSVVDDFNEGGVFTTFQIVENRDFESDDFNFKWE